MFCWLAERFLKRVRALNRTPRNVTRTGRTWHVVGQGGWAQQVEIVKAASHVTGYPCTRSNAARLTGHGICIGVEESDRFENGVSKKTWERLLQGIPRGPATERSAPVLITTSQRKTRARGWLPQRVN